MRSSAFFIAFTIYLIVAIGLGQRLLLWPAIWLFPGRRRRMVRGWLRFHARATLAMARAIANVRVSIRGTLPPESCIVVMNHQSVLDIPIGLSLVPGPYPLIPTRDRYRRGIPGIAPLARVARFPFLSQKRVLSRAELAALNAAADQVARGEQSLLIFPEGHRSRDGGIGRFMRSGLRIVLSRATRPVYCVVADGMVNARSFTDALVGFADLDVRIIIFGPLDPPPHDDEAVDAFIDSLHERMAGVLAELRSTTSTGSASAADSVVKS